MPTSPPAPVYLDSNVVFYAASADREFGTGCSRVLGDIQGGGLYAISSALIVSEVANAMRKSGKAKGMDRIAAALTSLPMRFIDVTDALALDGVRIAREAGISPYDGVHAATMFSLGIEVIVSTDTDFDRIATIRRLDPRTYGSTEGS